MGSKKKKVVLGLLPENWSCKASTYMIMTQRQEPIRLPRVRMRLFLPHPHTKRKKKTLIRVCEVDALSGSVVQNHPGIFCSYLELGSACGLQLQEDIEPTTLNFKILH